MPIVRVDSKEFHKQLGGEIKFEELRDRLFQFGIELSIEEIFEEKQVEEKQKGKVVTKIVKTKLRDEYLIETAANRPDLTNLELTALAAGVFLDFRKMPNFRVQNISEKREKIIVKKNTKLIRPFVVGAILRDIELDDTSYKSLIDLQDKLHLTFCRRRKLVAIGTHDYDTIKGPFIYDAKPPQEINFIALKQTQKMNGNQLMELYEKDSHMKDFVPIIKNSEVYPVILDSEGVVCSLPPIINGEHSKVTLKTKNIFIESTATDYNRAVQTLNVIVGAFSYYCKNQFTFEEVEIEYEEDGRKEVTPKWNSKVFYTSLDKIKKTGSVEVELNQAIQLLQRMQHQAEIESDGRIKVTVSPIRSDIIHECDIIEDVCIGYGYNNIKYVLPTFNSVGKQQFLNKMSDLIREEMAFIGYKEGLNFALNNHEDLTVKLRKKTDEQIVSISNPRTLEFTCGRTTLIPGMLKWLQGNKKNELPLRVFEVGDVVLKKDNEVGAGNQRRLCAMYTNTSAQFQVIHGVLDQIMTKLNVKDSFTNKTTKQKNSYEIRQTDDSTFFPKRGGEILLNGEKIGILGILHPEINNFYDWPYPISLFEINIERIIELFDNI